MIRIIAILGGLFFAVAAFWALGVGAYTAMTVETEETVEHEFYVHPKDVSFSSDGPLGTYDRAQLQRGLKVYQEVCAACHGMKFVAFRDLGALGYTEPEVAAIASQFQVPGVDPTTGEPVLRPAVATDYMVGPYPNDIAAAAANNNAIPPDLSLMTKARHDGSAYVYSLLSGYGPIPAELKAAYPDFETPQGLYFNQYFHNLNIAMAPPLTAAGQVTYSDGTDATISQMSKDVTAFMTWSAEPKLEQRRQTGFVFIGFLIFATILAYMSKKQVWAGAKPKKRKD
ncbi:Cytochrome c1 [Alteripontixanthobacter maritimus]|uniref:Cytochrome c1 n=1 Tax=Alteripontixanthobacter maritimus TaxID=2161824 RepID=A0A369Q846_9SPHN|nr:cytochrome c1 [Alteripontixanthobacter maritimus]RDC61063.1 Cytochrome c1 [Alteripontixanthobacter maritimus]